MTGSGCLNRSVNFTKFSTPGELDSPVSEVWVLRRGPGCGVRRAVLRPGSARVGGSGVGGSWNAGDGLRGVAGARRGAGAAGAGGRVRRPVKTLWVPRVGDEATCNAAGSCVTPGMSSIEEPPQRGESFRVHVASHQLVFLVQPKLIVGRTMYESVHAPPNERRNLCGRTTVHAHQRRSVFVLRTGRVELGVVVVVIETICLQTLVLPVVRITVAMACAIVVAVQHRLSVQTVHRMHGVRDAVTCRSEGSCGGGGVTLVVCREVSLRTMQYQRMRDLPSLRPPREVAGFVEMTVSVSQQSVFNRILRARSPGCSYRPCRTSSCCLATAAQETLQTQQQNLMTHVRKLPQRSVKLHHHVNIYLGIQTSRTFFASVLQPKEYKNLQLDPKRNLFIHSNNHACLSPHFNLAREKKSI